jgi:hypothetical protein
MSNYHLFMDESGDHSLKSVDSGFPVFVLVGLLIEDSEYSRICLEVDALKQRYFGTTEVVLHSRDIRKCNGPFKILFDLTTKQKFYNDLERVLSTANYKIVASAINKEKHIERYGKLADDPYEIALTFVLERILFETDNNHDQSSLKVMIEGRGDKEDAALAKRYNEILYRGTGQVTSDRLRRTYEEGLIVRKKRDNDCGLQLADLCAYPIAKHIINNSEPNPAFDVIKPKIRQGARGYIGYGIKIFPQ